MKALLLLLCALHIYTHSIEQNVGIGISTPAARLDVTKPGGDTPTAYFRGSLYMSRFNFSTDEHTYIRGGKVGSSVILNDVPGGKVGIGTMPVTNLDILSGNNWDLINSE